ncbi:MAG TPA: MFS transporter [Ignavibacteriaceae bacterium]|nr:MFS transporter [Ignavibacteriaceae bacterium]
MDDRLLQNNKPNIPAPPGQSKYQYLITSFRDQFSWEKTFTALRHPNYKLWFRGQMLSLFGTWMQRTAEGFLIFELTHSPLYLGYVGFAMGAPAWLFMMYAGVVADRFPKRTVLMITQAFMMVLATILAFLTFTGLIQPWHIITLAFFLGVANSFDAPARQAFVLELVERDDLTNAIALNSTIFNTATAVGPAIAGITYAFFGPAWCFTINAVSFIGVIIALKLMTLKPFIKAEIKTSALADLKEGLKYIYSEKIVLTIISLVGVISIFGISYITLLPAWAVTIMHGNAATNGFLQSARGLGALVSALFIASLGRFAFTGKLLTIGSFLFPILIMIFSFLELLPITLVVLFFIGFSIILIFNLANALIQRLVPDELRGRIMGVYSFTFFGFLPVGALLMGAMAEKFTEPIAVLIGALVTLSFSVLIWYRVPGLRRQQ